MVVNFMITIKRYISSINVSNKEHGFEILECYGKVLELFLSISDLFRDVFKKIAYLPMIQQHIFLFLDGEQNANQYLVASAHKSFDMVSFFENK